MLSNYQKNIWKSQNGLTVREALLLYIYSRIELLCKILYKYNVYSDMNSILLRLQFIANSDQLFPTLLLINTNVIKALVFAKNIGLTILSLN